MHYSNLRRVLIENFLLEDLTRIITKTKESHNVDYFFTYLTPEIYVNKKRKCGVDSRLLNRRLWKDLAEINDTIPPHLNSMGYMHRGCIAT